ncbi:MAG: hypothetical protein LBG87_00900 [Spirochaetaceae bacterium]|jgi:hypothetical protein|nr:hypothetical protein [Spirochaetaceae bacterium]
MRRIGIVFLLMFCVTAAYGLNNRLYANGLWGVSYVAKTDEYLTFHGGNIGWHGLLINNREDYWESGFGSYNLGFFAEAGYIQYYGKDTDFPSVKFSFGLSVGQYFVFYLKPNFFLHNFESLGMSATGGVKIHLFMNDLALAYGIGIDFLPMMHLVGDYQIPKVAAGIQLTVDLVYEINRTKRKRAADAAR